MADTEHKVLAEEAKEASEDANKKAPYVYDPKGRFTGNGVMFKAKLFGTADVNEPRGDAVCNVAIGLLKSAVKNTGEHKQKIFFKINMSGITLVDGVNQSTRYEHPVNKISFISKDPNDSRAFGYIVTEKEGKHVYFGIKTEKAAEQVVLSLRDMFQAVFDAKKKEAEEKGKEEKESTTSDVPKPEETTTKTAEDVPTTPTTEPVLGEAAELKENKPVERENSSSHLLDLLGDLSFSPTPQPAAIPATQPWPPQNAAALSWGNAVHAQNDPFATQSFAQQPQMAFPQQQLPQQQLPQQQLPQQQLQQQQLPQQQLQQQTQQQHGFQQPFSQPNVQSPFSQPQMFPGQQHPQVINPQSAQSVFGAPQTQPPMFQQPAQPRPTMTSPFGQQQQQVQTAPFPNDPFSTTNVFQQPAPQMQSVAPQQAGNPFASTGNQSFGVLQPQTVPQPVQHPPYSQSQVHQAGNLFSDLNPLPSTNQQLGKDQFFNDVKNPPKPKMNEMQANQTPDAAATNMTIYANQPMANVTNTPQTYDWLNQLMGGPIENEQPAKPDANAPAGLIAPPPSHSRQRQGQPPLVGPYVN